MIKQLLPCLFVLLLFIACNNQKQEHTPANNNTVATREQLLKDSVTAFPESLLLKEQLIQLYRDSAEYDEAIKIVNDALLKDSVNDRLWDIKATLHFENEDTVNAIKAYERAIQVNPVPRYITSLGSLYAQTKNRRALDLADILLQMKITDTDKEAFFIKGLYYNYTGEKEKAISFFDKCLSMDYTFMLAYREKGIALYDLGKYNEAIAVLNKAVTLQNNFDEGHYWLGRCLEKLNKPKEAIEEYKTAVMYSPDYVEAKEALKRLDVK